MMYCKAICFRDDKVAAQLKALGRSKWNGQNLLGYALMIVRKKHKMADK